MDQASTYHRLQLLLSVLSVLLAAGYLAALILTGVSTRLGSMLASFSPRWWLQLALALLLLGGTYRLLTFPLGWVRGFWLPRRFGLLHQPFSRWLWDGAKAAALAGSLGLLGVEIVYALLRATAWWWLWGALFFLVAAVVLTLVTPVWLIPLFYRLEPLPDGDLKDRLLKLAGKLGVPVLGVWVTDQSRKSRTANAAVTGLGRTRRIILFDTLVGRFTPDEVEVVLAHELGHHVHGDVWRGLVVQGALTLVTFWVADHLLRAGSAALGLGGPADVAGLPLFGLIVMGLSLVALPLGNGWSRRVEREADDFALRTTGAVEVFVAAMERLADLNLAEPRPHPVKEFFLYSHPSIGRRVARARAVGHRLS